MSRGGVAESAGGGVEIDVGGGDELFLGVAVQDGVHAGKQGCGVGCVGALRGGGEFDHRSDQRGRNAVAGYVGDKEAGLLRIGEEEVVEISGDRGHGNVTSGDVEMAGLRVGWRKDRGLDPACDFEFLLNFTELVVAFKAAL